MSAMHTQSKNQVSAYRRLLCVAQFQPRMHPRGVLLMMSLAFRYNMLVVVFTSTLDLDVEFRGNIRHEERFEIISFAYIIYMLFYFFIHTFIASAFTKAAGTQQYCNTSGQAFRHEGTLCALLSNDTYICEDRPPGATWLPHPLVPNCGPARARWDADTTGSP